MKESGERTFAAGVADEGGPFRNGSSRAGTNSPMLACSPSSSKGAARGAALGVVAFLALAGGAFFAWMPPAEEAPEPRGFGPPPVLAEPARREVVADTLEALGTARANELATISSKVSEILESIHFGDGAVVEKGDLLIQLRDAEQRAALADARAQLGERERQLERLRSVGSSGAVSQSAIDEERSRVESARAQVDLFAARVAERRIEAPFAGKLGLRQASPGDLVSPGDALVTLSDLTPMKVDFTAPERYIGRMRPGQRIEATSEAYPGETFVGRIQAVSPVVDVVTRAAQVRALLPNEEQRLLPGMLLNVRARLGEREALTVPESALSPEGDRQYLLVLDGDSVARRREVETGRRIGSRVEIVEGLGEGELVVTHGYRASDGQKVKVVEDEEVFTREAEQS